MINFFSSFSGQPWNPLLFFDPSEWWYSSGNRGGAPQFNFSNMPPPGTQWNYGIPNSQVPPLPQYGSGNGSSRRTGPGTNSGLNTSMNGNALNNNSNNVSNNHRKWRKTNANQNGSSSNKK